ncbi:MAG: hypothetical protein GC162_13120 [Planctomycetes bacterium]|nr:hypothetical protein [Planctomycetota bacterium]
MSVLSPMSRFAFLCCLLTLAACGAPQVNNTRLDAADLVAMSDQMTASLIASPAVVARTAASEPWIISMDRVSNQSNDIIPDREKWAFIARLRAQLSQSRALSERNLKFVLSYNTAGEVAERVGDRITPTHLLTATFYSATVANHQTRSDTYLCAFQLMSAKDDQILWEDKYEIKRAVMRNKLD